MRCATGRVCFNLRELLEAIRAVPDAVLEHHMMRCALEDHFELHEFPNDLARWCWTVPGRQRVWGSNWGWSTLTSSRRRPRCGRRWSNVMEDRLWGLDRVPWCRPGLELHLIESRLIAYDTGERIQHARRPAGGHRAHVAAVALLPRPRGAAADRGANRRFLAVAGDRPAPSVVGDDPARNRLLLPQFEPTSPGGDRGLSAIHRGGAGRSRGAPHEALGPLRRDRRPPGSGAAPPLGRAAGGQADRSRQFHPQRRRRGRNPRLDGPADGGGGDQRPLGGDHRAARVLSRHQGLP